MRYGLVVCLALLTYSTVAVGQGLGVGPAQEISAGAEANFTVGDIKVEGLQRITEGAVFNYLPINIGDKLDAQRVREAIRALYNTGFFRDVQMRRDGNTLIVVVLERPSIESFEIKGNKAIKTEDLQKSLRGVGLSAGKTFNRSILEQVTSYLTEQYFGQGKYGVKIDASVQEESDNRVKVKITIQEGDRAKIREINVVGNRHYTEKELLAAFQLKTPNWLSWYKQDDRYSRESLQGDIETLRSYYMDRGYANFQVNSTQVQISPQKDEIFITLNVAEGLVYKISSVKLAGTFVVPEAELRRFVLVKPGATYSRKLITASQDLIQNRLGEDGYAFAKVDPVPTTNDQTHEVALTFFVDPGNRVYVRNISFAGVEKINDEVLRREMRQLEGGWVSNAALERSKQRLQRLPYVKKVDSSTDPVPGSPDQVDVNYKLEEGPDSSISGGVGYSQLYKLVLNGDFTDADFLGSGQRISVDLSGGAYNKVYTISESDPYATINNVSRIIDLSYSDTSQFIATSSQFSSKVLRAGLGFSYPISEMQGLNFGVDVQDAQLIAIDEDSSLQAQEWVQDNGNAYRYSGGVGSVYDYYTGNYVTETAEAYGTRFVVPEVSGGWIYDSRNKTLFADHGLYAQLAGSYTLPLQEVQYWKANINVLQYVPLIGSFKADFNFQFGYGQGLGQTTALPPFALYYGGGPDSVRGFYPGSLGPRDQFGNPYGGNVNVLARAEIILPSPAKFEDSARIKLFLDAGNIFSTTRCVTDSSNQHVCGPQFYAPAFGYSTGLIIPGTLGPPISYAPSIGNLKESVGIAVEWLAPMGLFRFSFGVPLKTKSEIDGVTWGDDVERFQFDVGNAF